MWIRQKLGMILEKLMLEKNGLPNLIFQNDKLRKKLPLIFDLENGLCKYNFDTF